MLMVLPAKRLSAGCARTALLVMVKTATQSMRANSAGRRIVTLL
jgi:hypothetical protein